MALFMLLIWRCFEVAMHAPDRYGMLLSGGIGIMIAIQVIMNVAVVTSSMPPTGVALPFISYGGNALWICMGAVGVVLNISRQTNLAEIEAKKAEEAEKQKEAVDIDLSGIDVDLKGVESAASDSVAGDILADAAEGSKVV